MEYIPIVLAFSLMGFITAFAALTFSVWNFIEMQAQKRSTHTVIPVSPETTMSKIEQEIEKITKSVGGDQQDLNRGLFEYGNVDVDDLV